MDLNKLTEYHRWAQMNEQKNNGVLAEVQVVFISLEATMITRQVAMRRQFRLLRCPQIETNVRILYAQRILYRKIEEKKKINEISLAEKAVKRVIWAHIWS